MRDVLVRHDWTYRELQALAHMSARRVSVGTFDLEERADVAFLAIIELLWAVNERPERPHLIHHGYLAVQAWTGKELSAHGTNQNMEPATRFACYWSEPPAEPVTERIVERLALGHVYLAMDEQDQEILWTRAMFVQVKDAAAALKMHSGQFSKELGAARRRATRLWFDEETPVPWGRRRDRRAMSEKNRRDTTRGRLTRGRAS